MHCQLHCLGHHRRLLPLIGRAWPHVTLYWVMIGRSSAAGRARSGSPIIKERWWVGMGSSIFNDFQRFSGWGTLLSCHLNASTLTQHSSGDVRFNSFQINWKRILGSQEYHEIFSKYLNPTIPNAILVMKMMTSRVIKSSKRVNSASAVWRSPFYYRQSSPNWNTTTSLN